jgi:hypothetical protein
MNTDLDNMSVKDLKTYITSKGGNPNSCVEKKDLISLAKTLSIPTVITATTTTTTTTSSKPSNNSTPINSSSAKQSTPPKTTPSPNHTTPPKSSSNIPITTKTTTSTKQFDDSDDDMDDDDELDEDSDDDYSRPNSNSTTPPGSATTTTTNNNNSGSGEKSRKNSLAFRATKFVTSKVGNTRAGRNTVLKILGDDGDTVIKAFKSATTKLDGKLVAKEKKKDAIRLVMKAYNLWRHKDITVENTRELQIQAQLFGEMFVRDSSSVSRVRGNRNVTALVRVAVKVRDAAAKVMKPFIQEKNLTTLIDILTYYGSNRFLQVLLNGPDYIDECQSIEHACGAMLSSMPPLLLGESEKAALRHRKDLLKLLNKGDNLPLERAMEDPKLLVLFQEYLDLEMGLSNKNTLRLLIAIREYEKISSRNIMKIRAPKLIEKFLLPKGDCFVDGIDSTILTSIKEQVDSGMINSSLFNPILILIRKNLEDDFYQSFLPSEDFVKYKNDLIGEITRTEGLLKEQGSIESDGFRSP